MRRGCLFGLVGALGLCVVGCGLIYFLAIPAIRDGAENAIEDGMSTVVAAQIPATNGAAAPGSYAFTQEELQRSLIANLGSSAVDNIVLTIDESGIEIGLSSEGGQGTTYSGLPTVVDGKLVMENMKASDRMMEFFVPASSIGDALENSVNEYLAQNGLEISSLELTQGAISFDTTKLP